MWIIKIVVFMDLDEVSVQLTYDYIYNLRQFRNLLTEGSLQDILKVIKIYKTVLRAYRMAINLFYNFFHFLGGLFLALDSALTQRF